jgi:hypothetical protein
MTTITITWKAFENATSKTFETEVGENLHPVSVCEMVFQNTNLYRGELWDALQPLPEDRTHTALSVGDEVTINGQTYRCEDIGFKEVV